MEIYKNLSFQIKRLGFKNTEISKKLRVSYYIISDIIRGKNGNI